MESIWNLRLRNAPAGPKCLALGYVFALGFAYVYAMANIALVVGLTPKDIAVHYYGSENVIVERTVPAAGEETFSLDEIESPPAEAIQPRPSLKNIVTEGHFHLFGMTTFFFGLTLLVLFTGVPAVWKPWLVGVPYILVVIDNLSFLATRFLGPKFAYLTMISGILMASVFTVLWVLVVREVLLSQEGK